jgi:hypothetical protein
MDGEPEDTVLSNSGAMSLTASRELRIEEEEVNKRMVKLVEAAFQEYNLDENQSISFEQFQDWFSKTPIATQFLETIKKVSSTLTLACHIATDQSVLIIRLTRVVCQMSNIVLGLRPTSARDER